MGGVESGERWPRHEVGVRSRSGRIGVEWSGEGGKRSYKKNPYGGGGVERRKGWPERENVINESNSHTHTHTHT